MLTQPKIQVIDKNGKVLAEAVAKSTAQRISMKLSAWQRQLDSMYVKEAVTGKIGDTKFVFDKNGNSQFVGI